MPTIREIKTKKKIRARTEPTSRKIANRDKTNWKSIIEVRNGHGEGRTR
jgi:hypothetical protein